MGRVPERTTKTKEKIRDAFFELCATKKIEKISIKEIMEKAHLNRGTFYVYYKDIYDLLEKAEDEIIDNLSDKVRIVVEKLIQGEDIDLFLPPLSFYEQHSKHFRVLTGKYGDPQFTYRIKSVMKGVLRQAIERENYSQVKNIEYLLEYIASAQIGVITYWMLEDNMNLPVAEIGEMIQKITQEGPVAYLKSQTQEQGR